MPIRVLAQDTSADTDVFQGTDLERVPGPGILEVYQASTVNTATITAVVGEDNLVRGQPIPLKTNGIPNVNEDEPLLVYETDVGGEKVALNLGGTTGTVHTLGVWTGEDEL